ncbi:ATP-binding cassette sub-family B member 10, mitochondrial [Symbiodinium microadriaticum]|uniref:ATP-binding cassette sub-family B member 10, mitochondrial n=1 Tax=Symbiodinium microadriaticum TaxID=2951 RepID=A0A1Q9CWE7_SYMMI|nr:ATP-binding cassette sub-family B member 10, mitochondrial [Symbiodinium microadriaticum]
MTAQCPKTLVLRLWPELTWTHVGGGERRPQHRPMHEADAWLLRHLWPELAPLTLGAGALAVASFVNFRTGAQLKQAIESAEEGRSSAARSLLLFGLGALAGCVRTISFDSTSERLRASMAVEVFAARLLEEPQVSSDASGASQNKASVASMESDVALCADFILKLQNLVRYASSIVGGTVTMFRASWKLSAAVWPLLVTGALHGARAGAKRSAKSAEALAATREEASAFAEERLQHLDLVRWFCRAEEEAQQFGKLCDASVAIASRSARVRGASHLVLDWAAKSVLLGLASLGSQLVARGELTAGELTSYFFHASFLGLGLYGLVGLMPEVAVGRAAARRLESVVAAGRRKEAADSPSLSKPPAPLPLSFEDVHFRYSEAEVLSGFSLQLAAGETCALVGLSGCGKTSALRLLLRDFETSSGKITLGGQLLQMLDLAHVRTLISVFPVAPQTPALLGTSVASAIAFGASGEASKEQIEAASKAASAHDFVKCRPQGYETPVGRGGELMSGGERQRLALARALIREAPILLLDEPTSGLDAATASALAQAVLSPRPSRPTTLIATHSLALIRSCETVAVVSGGRVVQRGSFSELITDSSGHLAQIMRSGELEET